MFPRFIKKIATGNLAGSARTIFEANLLGATCARVCPVEELCEGACVLGAEHQPIMIGRLQRYAMDHVYQTDRDSSAAPTGQALRRGRLGTGWAILCGRIGPPRSRCDRLRKTRAGRRPFHYGIIALREPVEAAFDEVAMIERLGVSIETAAELGRISRSTTAPALRRCFSARAGSHARHGHSRRRADFDGLEYIEESKLNTAR